MSVTLEGFEYQKDLYCKFCLSPQTDFGSEPNPLNLGLKLCLIYLRILWKPVCGKNSNLLIFILFSKQFDFVKNQSFLWTLGFLLRKSHMLPKKGVKEHV